ncbi:phosphatidylethanolamine N-methyltransferase isoform X4 [Meles meles]|uniref:phosphatidylethanolamine N-methyltransferase isoform X4 n=1 Tax=Meles meles TaxID=9662 RepID=UPI001E69E23F|nr:phosphatidylethanolamine N-methyltransferase isoform X4 [Meles meles]
MSSSAAGPDCCGGLGNVDFGQADLYVMTWLLGYMDPLDPCFVAAVLTITFNPLFWNVVARWEQKTRQLSRAFRSPYLACYSLGAAILLLNVLRSHCFTQAMLSQPKMESLDNPTAYRVGLALLGVGSTFVLSSFFALGFTGTFLGMVWPAWEPPVLPCLIHRRLLWDPQGGKSDHVPIQRPGQPHVLGQHGQLPGLGRHARQPHRPAADRGCGPRLHGRHPVRGALHCSDLPAEGLPVPQEELTGPVPRR